MNKAKKRVFSKEFKYEAAQLVLTENYAICDAAKAMNIGKSTLSKWINHIRVEQRDGTQAKTCITPEQQHIKELEKRYSSFNVGLHQQFELLNDLKKSYAVKTLCEVFTIHRSSYKHWVRNKKVICPKKVEEKAMVKQIFNESKQSAAARTIATIATTNGVKLSRYRASNLMKKLNLVSCQQRTHRYKVAKKEHVKIAHHLNRQFDVKVPNQVWCGDVTYIWAGNKWVYLAVVMDLFSRKIIGYSLSNSPSTDLTEAALTMAFELRGRPAQLMFHSDQGVHYTSEQYRPVIPQ